MKNRESQSTSEQPASSAGESSRQPAKAAEATGSENGSYRPLNPSMDPTAPLETTSRREGSDRDSAGDSATPSGRGPGERRRDQEKGRDRDRDRPRSRSRKRRRRDEDGDRDRDRDRDNGSTEQDPSGGADRGEEGSGEASGRGRNRNRNRNRRRREREAPVDPGPPVEVEGIVEVSPKGFGFVRQANRNFNQSPDDVFITPEIVRVHSLRDGVFVKCLSCQGKRGPQLTEIQEINGRDPESYKNLPYFEELTAINPNKRLALETTPERYTTRVMDMMTPVGRGQRGLIVAPPRTGKTTLLQHIAEAIYENYEEQMHLMVLLVDERPEEVTDFQRTLPHAEIMASSNDSDVKSHIRIAQLAIERAKRLVEAGEHVFLLMDSITRLARAFNNATKGKGRTMSGGIDVKALEIPRKLFAAARNTREGGSLTIIATALIQTNSKMDELIYQEFKGTGNLELVLDRSIAQNYIYPAVNIHASGTRREELILPGHMLEKIHVIRRGLAGHKPVEAMERLLSFLERFPGNAQMLMEIKATAVE